MTTDLDWFNDLSDEDKRLCRNACLIALRRKDRHRWTFESLGVMVGISRERIRQIIDTNHTVFDQKFIYLVEVMTEAGPVIDGAFTDRNNARLFADELAKDSDPTDRIRVLSYEVGESYYCADAPYLYEIWGKGK